MKSREKVIQLLIKQQKTRTNVIKQMNRQRNGCLSFVSNQIGYNSWQDEKERKRNGVMLRRFSKLLRMVETKIK